MCEHYDIIIRDAEIVDGTGSPAYTGSVGIRGEKIAAVGDVKGDATKVIEGFGLVTCPGFIDPHSHADISILEYPLAENLVMQGITTFVEGNCGLSLAPLKHPASVEIMMEKLGLDFGLDADWRTFSEWLSRVEARGLSINYAPLVGHNMVRGTILGKDFKRTATLEEIEEMKRLVDQAMGSGAFGLSSGLDYWPSDFASVEEIVSLAKVVQQYDGFFTPHTRHVNNQWPADRLDEYGYGTVQTRKGEVLAGRYHGLLEAVEISKKANNVRLHIAHIPPAYAIPQPHPSLLDRAVAEATLAEIVDRAREKGTDVTYNVIAWSHGVGGQSIMLETFFNPRLSLPEWLGTLSKRKFTEKLETRRFREQVKRFVYSGRFKFGMVHPLVDPYWADCFLVVQCNNREYVGKTIGEIARAKRSNDILEIVYEESIETVFDIIVKDPNAMWATILDKRMHEESQAVFLKHPAGMPCTDVWALAMTSDPTGVGGGSPTAYGLYPHYLRRFVKEKRVLGLEEAVKKATSVPAEMVLGLKDRGVIKEGVYADIVLLDFDRIKEGWYFMEPIQPPEGIEYVLVNGTVVYHKKRHSGERPGKVLRHS